jgi:hypothetical protein
MTVFLQLNLMSVAPASFIHLQRGLVSFEHDTADYQAGRVDALTGAGDPDRVDLVCGQVLQADLGAVQPAGGAICAQCSKLSIYKRAGWSIGHLASTDKMWTVKEESSVYFPPTASHYHPPPLLRNYYRNKDKLQT